MVARNRLRIPSLRLHKPSGRAVVTVRGRDIYCGPYGSAEADERYRQVVAEIASNGPQAVRHHGVTGSRSGSRSARSFTVAELLFAYLEHAEKTYLPPSRECETLRVAIRPVVDLYGAIQASDFTASKLTAVRESWIAEKLARKHINAKVGRVVRIWKWGVERELVPVSTWQSLRSVAGLKHGRSSAEETAPVEGVPEADFRATLPHLQPPVAAMLEVLWYTGARSGEIRNIRTCDIVRDCVPWHYAPKRHKNSHRGHKRVIFFGPRARQVLEPFLDDANPEAFIFSPKKSIQALKDSSKNPARTDRQRQRSAERKRKEAAEARRHKSGKSLPKSSRRPGNHYPRHSLTNAVRLACSKHEIPHWHPHQLRHACKDRLEEAAGIESFNAVAGIATASEATQATLGHSSKKMTSRYGSTSFGLAAITMEKYG